VSVVVWIERLLFHGELPFERDAVSPMLGVNATTDSVSRFKKVAWRRTLGWRK